MIVIVIFGELRWPICSICFPLQINISVDFKTESSSITNFAQNQSWIPWWQHGIRTRWHWAYSRALFQEALIESAQKAIVLFFQLAFDVSLNVPRIRGSKLKTRIIFRDRKFTNSVFLNCCCQALYMLLKCSRLEEVLEYNKAPWPRIRLSEYRFLNSGRQKEEYYPDTRPLPKRVQAPWHRIWLR